MASISREVRLKSRPNGLPKLDDFELATIHLPSPQVGEVQVKNYWMTVDPYMRGRMNDTPSYFPPYQLNKAMDGGAIGEVVVSNAPGFEPGDLVLSMYGWRESFVAPADAVQPLDLLGLPPQVFLGAAGMPGLTAFVGLTRIAQIKPGDVVFVSGAAGAVGQMACQIAKIKGHTVIGSAGGAEKGRFLESLGVDHVIDYQAVPDLTDALRSAAPNGIDVYFDNVGGEHLDAALAVANPFARFALCGMISQYNNTDGDSLTRGMVAAVFKQLRLEGFIISGYFDMMPDFLKSVATWIAEDRLVWTESIEHGIDRAPAAFLKLFTGQNNGKMLVKLD